MTTVLRCDISLALTNIIESCFKATIVLFFHSCKNLPVYLIKSNVAFFRLDAANAVMNLFYDGGTTNTADGLATVTDELFTPENGDRANASNLLIVITDGESNNKQLTVAQAIRAKTTQNIQVSFYYIT